MAVQPPHTAQHHHEHDNPWKFEAIAIGVVAVVALTLILILRPWTNRSQPYSAATVLHPTGPVPVTTIQR
jgi:hypothetical protein